MAGCCCAIEHRRACCTKAVQQVIYWIISTKPSSCAVLVWVGVGGDLRGRPSSWGRPPTFSQGGWPTEAKGSNKTFKGRLVEGIQGQPTLSLLMPNTHEYESKQKLVTLEHSDIIVLIIKTSSWERNSHWFSARWEKNPSFLSPTYPHKHSHTWSFNLVINLGVLATGLVGYPCFLALISNTRWKNKLWVCVRASALLSHSLCASCFCMSECIFGHMSVSQACAFL